MLNWVVSLIAVLTGPSAVPVGFARTVLTHPFVYEYGRILHPSTCTEQPC